MKTKLKEWSEKPQSLEENLSHPIAKTEFGYYADLVAANDINDFKQRIDNATKRLGFTEYVFIRLAHSDTNPREINTITPGLSSAYYDAGLFEHDITLPYAGKETKDFYQSTIHDYVFNAPFNLERITTIREVSDLGVSFGYYDYYNIPSAAHNGNGNVMFSVTQRGLHSPDLKAKVQGCELTLRLLCEAIDYVATQKFADDLIGAEKLQSARINPKPLRVLAALATNDLSITELAHRLCISPATANQHLDTVRKALNVKTNIAAIRQAVKMKLIDF